MELNYIIYKFILYFPCISFLMVHTIGIHIYLERAEMDYLENRGIEITEEGDLYCCCPDPCCAEEMDCVETWSSCNDGDFIVYGTFKCHNCGNEFTEGII